VSASNIPFLVLETRDVSIGFVTNPSTFASIVYDRDDNIKRDLDRGAAAWHKRYGQYFHDTTITEVDHLFRHYFLVWTELP